MVKLPLKCCSERQYNAKRVKQLEGLLQWTRTRLRWEGLSTVEIDHVLEIFTAKSQSQTDEYPLEVNQSRPEPG